MNNPDELTAKDIRRWYQKHGMPYEEEDWGPRSAVGESIGQQTQDREREGRDGVRSTATTPDRMWWWEDKPMPWSKRSHSEQLWMEMLDDFFAPYIALLPRAKGNLVESVYTAQLTYAEVGADAGVSRQAAQQATKKAIRELTRSIAEDDPDFTPGRPRDYAAETQAARRVFVRFAEAYTSLGS